jgi:hypothetical protein
MHGRINFQVILPIKAVPAIHLETFCPSSIAPRLKSNILFGKISDGEAERLESWNGG